jgi:hypothetical protein
MKFANAESSALIIFAFGFLALPQPKTGLAEPSQFNIFRSAILEKYRQHLRCKGASSWTSWTEGSMDLNASKTRAQYCSVAAAAVGMFGPCCLCHRSSIAYGFDSCGPVLLWLGVIGNIHPISDCFTEYWDANE